MLPLAYGFFLNLVLVGVAGAGLLLGVLGGLGLLTIILPS